MESILSISNLIFSLNCWIPDCFLTSNTREHANKCDFALCFAYYWNQKHLFFRLKTLKPEMYSFYSVTITILVALIFKIKKKLQNCHDWDTFGRKISNNLESDYWISMKLISSLKHWIANLRNIIKQTKTAIYQF